jgi:putative SOS response-associated peptidase YedK
MCYHVSVPGKNDLRKQYKTKKVEYQGEEIFHVSGFVRPQLPVTLSEDKESIIDGRWKLIPFWVKDEEGAAKYANTLNAEGESVFEKASYKPYILKNRGLLYVNGFFEPHKVIGVKESENYYLHLPEKRIFTLGIVWSWFNGYPTFTILTTTANPQLAEIHNEKKRMPLLIEEQDHQAWLSTQDPMEVKQLIRPWEGEFQAKRVARVTASKGDTNYPEIQNEI